MSQFTDDLMKQFRFISEASNAFMRQNKQHLSGQQRVLAILAVEDGLIQSYLAEVLDLRPSSLAELLKKMENSHDILRKEDDNDKRIKRVYLTETGRKKAEQNAASGEKNASDDFFAGLNEAEQAEFSQLLGKIPAGWEPEMKKQAEKFVDPMDRMQAIQALKESYLDQYGDWRDMSHEDIKKLKKEMRENFKELGFFGHRGGFGGRPPFGGRNFGRPPFDQKDQDEWHDF